MIGIGNMADVVLSDGQRANTDGKQERFAIQSIHTCRIDVEFGC
jgi:23S rRNA U2552 (ribose-2'-O)-methylase RlmE/FtsJ